MYTRVNSNEHFHAIKLKKNLLVSKMIREREREKEACARKRLRKVKARKGDEGMRGLTKILTLF